MVAKGIKFLEGIQISRAVRLDIREVKIKSIVNTLSVRLLSCFLLHNLINVGFTG